MVTSVQTKTTFHARVVFALTIRGTIIGDVYLATAQLIATKDISATLDVALLVCFPMELDAQHQAAVSPALAKVADAKAIKLMVAGAIQNINARQKYVMLRYATEQQNNKSKNLLQNQIKQNHSIKQKKKRKSLLYKILLEKLTILKISVYQQLKSNIETVIKNTALQLVTSSFKNL